MWIASDYIETVRSAFQFEANQSFCQIATVARDKDQCMPKSRTVRLYLEQERNALRFNCSTQSQKWHQLQTTPKATGLYMDWQTATQYRFEADAVLIDKQSSDEVSFFEMTWHKMRPDLRHILWQEYLGDAQADYDIEQIHPCHGVVLLKPYFWDIFQLDKQDYGQSKRNQIIWQHDQWRIVDNASIVSPQEPS